MAAAMLLGASSCKDDTFNFYEDDQSEEVKVTFSLAPEGPLTTRADGFAAQISDGSKADMLVYAVYDEEGNLLEEYGLGKASDVPENKAVGRGQTAMMFEYPGIVSITLKRGEKYQIAFWGQSSKTTAYNTSDLKKVEVNYSQITDEESGDSNSDSSSTPNNDEMRDAFCRTITVEAGKNHGVAQNVHLFRPLAQINVGTSGFDYEIATRETKNKYTYSKIRINRVARYLDVVADKTYTSTTKDDEEDDEGNTIVHKTPEAFAVVDYGWAPIPAYANMHDSNGDVYDVTIPDYPSYSKWDWLYDGAFVLNRDGKTFAKKEALGDDGISGIYGKEYFLNVRRNDLKADEAMPSVEDMDKDNNGYRDYATLTKYNNKESETFKYLSMCYVLTSSTETEPVVINNIKVWLATDKDGSDEYELLNINQVPAQKNWRTNIIGNLMTEKNTFEIKLDKDFAGEYSGWGPTWEWTGPIAEGLFYDGANDVIEISSREGLVWFQRLVNGDLTVRKAPTVDYIDNIFENKNVGHAIVGDPYPYYYKNSRGTYTTRDITYKTAADFSDEVKKRIMVATHQINKNNGKGTWPENNNFHFVGDDPTDRATVRLMADIDLSGEDWIPIGFDGRIAEQLQDRFDDSDGSNRGFYGVFDGNGHTISNLYTKRFSAAVHGKTQQDGDSKDGPSDNPQWFGRGLFGEIGGSAKILNVRLFNVDIYGCNGVAGIVGIAYGNDIEINNCIVDGGKIEATPMLRGDSKKNTKRRTIARGVYVGGIVGYFYTQGGIIDNCEVRNLIVKGVRRVGGLIGSFTQKEFGDGTNEVDKLPESFPNPTVTSVSNNRITNTRVIVNSYNTYGMAAEILDKAKSKTKSGFGYNASPFLPYSNPWVGGHVKDFKERTDIKNPQGGSPKFEGNSESGLTFSNISTMLDGETNYRNSIVQELPLNEMPMLSSWFADIIDLEANYYGEPSSHIRHYLYPYNFDSRYEQNYPMAGKKASSLIVNNEAGQRNTFFIPMDMPFEVTIDWDQDSPKAGVFVESVTLNGKKGIGGRSVITSTGLLGEDDCVMYITSRDRQQFLVNETFYKKPTKVSNVVLRGEPYANTGVLMAPNSQVKEITLEDVAIYDVYKTLALDDWSSQNDFKVWPNTYNPSENPGSYLQNMFFGDFQETVLNVTRSNLRGFTVPGRIGTVNYDATTFERGASTGHGDDEFTCKVESETKFSACYFKAPYIIDLTELPSGKTVTFEGCNASSSEANSNVPIENDKAKQSDKIVIENNQGKPVVKYYKSSELKWTVE